MVPGGPNQDDPAGVRSKRNEPLAAGSDVHRKGTAGAGTVGKGMTGSGTARAAGSFHGHWLGVGAASLPGQLQWASQDPSTINVLGAATGATMTAGEYIALINRSGARTLNRLYGGAMWGGLLVNTGIQLYDLGVNARQLANNPDSEETKWRLANSAVHFFANGAAMLLMPFAPGIGFAPLLLPDFSEVNRAVQLGKQQSALERKGQQTEAGAAGQAHTLAALNATPVINWFAPFYQNALTPDVEKFEHAQGNFDGQPAQAELPPGTGNKPAVTDYYGNAMKERGQRVAENMTPFLRDAAQKNGKDYVTLISHWPQTFCWPSSGKPMRTFDRAIALTYSRKTDTVSATFFGRDVDGSFRTPPNNQDIPLQQGSQHLFFFSRMLDPDKQEEVLKLHE
jgi:hypothetical protein